MTKALDPKKLIGKKYGRLTLISAAYRGKNSKSFWWMECDCGKEKIISLMDVIYPYSNIKSCGCLHDESARMNRRHGQTINGKATRTYASWSGMKNRCQNTSDANYRYYGGRGIVVCDEWQSFDNFYRDMGERPKKTSLDRRDNNGDYCKENCRWATPKEQARNTSKNHYIEYKGSTRMIAEWAEITGLDYGCLLWRIRNGWSVNTALSLPSRKK